MDIVSSDHPDRPDLAPLLELTPAHALPSDGSIRVVRLTGRPRKVDPRPTISQIEYNDRLNALRDQWVGTDDLVELLARPGPSDVAEVVQRVRVQIARECAAIAYEIRQAHAKGRDPEVLHQRRIDGLLKLASIEIVRVKMNVDSFDPNSAKVQLVVREFLRAVGEVAVETLPEASATAFIERLEMAAVDWEDAVADPI